MTETISELWSERDQAAVANLKRAVAEDDLLSAMLAIEGASAAVSLEVAKTLARLLAGLRYIIDADVGIGRPVDPVHMLVRILARIFKLQGTPDDIYYHPDSGKLSRVLVTKRGNPITVCAIWMLVGQAAGFDVRGVGFPKHFFVMVDGRYIDPFHHGHEMSIEDLRAVATTLVPHMRFDPAWVAPVSILGMVERVLINVVHVHRKAHDLFGAYRALRLFAGLRPHDAAMQLEVAVDSETLGAWGEARGMYRDIIRNFPGTREAQVAELRRLEMQQRQRTLH